MHVHIVAHSALLFYSCIFNNRTISFRSWYWFDEEGDEEVGEAKVKEEEVGGAGH